MYSEAFYHKVGYPQTMLNEVAAINVVPYETWHHDFYYHRERFFETIDAQYGDPLRFQVYMKLYMCLFYERYMTARMPFAKKILWDGMLDLLEWGNVCHHFYHVWGIMPNMWRFVDRIIEGRIVHLGCLQFEVKAINKEISTAKLCLKEHTVLINVHVPAQPSLDHDACLASYEMAQAYFSGISPIFHCESWLLSPQLKRCLPPTSNIMQFQSDYDCYEIHEESTSMIQRVFLDQEDIPSTYAQFEEDTTLQRKAKQLLLQGEYLQSAAGIFLWPDHDHIVLPSSPAMKKPNG